MRPRGVGARIDAAIVVEVQVVRAVACARQICIEWCTRPIAAAVADTVETAIAVVAITRSRQEDAISYFGVIVGTTKVHSF